MACPAYNLITNGTWGTTLWDESLWPGIHTHTYYTMPLYTVVQAGWYKVTGVSLLSMRLLSLACALLTLLACCGLMRGLSFGPGTALLGMALIAFDYVFIMGSSIGRMDMMAAMFGFGSLAAYTMLRQRSLTAALATAASLSAAAVSTHPIAIAHFCALGVLILYFDRKRLSLLHYAVMAVPFIMAAALFGFHASRSPADFVAQFRANANYGGRLDAIRSPFVALRSELVRRYLTAYGLGGHSPGHRGPIVLKSVALFAYLAGLAGLFVIRELRRHAQYRALLFLITVEILLIAVIDGTRNTYYLVHVTPLFAITLALVAGYAISRGWVPAWAVGAALAVVVVIEACGIVYKARIDTYTNQYLPVVEFLKPRLGPHAVVAGSSAFAFAFGFDGTRLRDDARFGYASGVKPDFIIVDEFYREMLDGHRKHRPAIAEYVTRLLATEYQPIYDTPVAVIYQHTPPSAARELAGKRVIGLPQAPPRAEGENRTANVDRLP